jgi:hypothetical protein
MTKTIKGPKMGKIITGIISSFRNEVFPEKIKKMLIMERNIWNNIRICTG